MESVNGTLYYLVGDNLGSVSVTLTNGGSVQATQLYAPYGAVRYSSGTMPTSYGFTKQRLDGSGLNYFHARYYDSSLGQFTSADTVQGPNRYAYTGGNPETRTDPTGYCFLVCAIIGAVAGAVVGTIAAVSAIQQGEPPLNAIAHAAVDVGLGFAAGAVLTSPGAIAGLITSTAGVLFSAATGSVNLLTPGGLQSSFEAVAVGTISGAVSGAMGKSLLTSLSGIKAGTPAFFAAASRSAAAFALGSGVVSAEATSFLGALPMLDGKPAHLNPAEVALSFFLGVGAGFVGGGIGFAMRSPTVINNVGGIIGGVANTLFAGASNAADHQEYGNSNNPGGNNGSLYVNRGGVIAF